MATKQVSIENVITGLFLNYITHNDVDFLQDIKAEAKSAQNLARAAQQLEFAGNQEESDSFYFLYENAMLKVNTKITNFAKAFANHYYDFSIIVEDITSSQLVEFAKAKVRKVISEN